MRRKTKTRWVSQPLNGKSASMPAYDHEALADGRTMYPSTVRAARDGTRWALKSSNNRKIGGEILKGRWMGFPAYTLSLEERATCPTSCLHWRSCMGNRMHWVDRVQAGADLEWRLVSNSK